MIKKPGPLRLHGSSESDVAHLSISEVPVTPSQQRRHKGSILVIGDEPASLKLLFTILTEDGYAVHERKLDLESQLRFVKDTLPDLVLVDVRKPGTDGYQVCASLKNDPSTRSIPVIFISPIDRSVNQAKALLSGAVDYVTDPFDAEEVLWRIETHISLRRLRENLKSAACNYGAQAVTSNEDLERAFQEIHVLTQVTGRKHAEEKVRQAARELQKAEEALRGSERELGFIINTMPALVWSARPDGSAEFFNQHYLAYVGLPLEQLQGSGWTVAVHPDDLSAVAATWQLTLSSGKPGEAEARLRRFDGAYRWFLCRANPVRDDSGRIVKWYGTNIDIEDRKRGEGALLARELSWRQIVDNIPGLVATQSAMGQVEFLNRQTLEYFGKTNEELKNWALIGVVHPDDLPRVIEARTKSIETGQIYEVEHRCRRADGVYRWFQVRGLPVRDAEGEITAWYLLLTDIDDRKKAEEAMGAIVNAIPILAWSTTPDGSADFFNQRWLEYTGLPAEQVKGWGWQVTIHPDDVERLVDRWKLSVASGSATAAGAEARMRRFDGAYRWFLFRANPLRDESGNVLKWYGTSTDIDDRKRAEATLRQAYDSFADAQRLSRTGNFIVDVLADDHIWSEELYRIFEIDPATTIKLQIVHDLIHPEDLPTYDARMALSFGGADFDLVFRIVTRSGKVKRVHAAAHVIERVAGRPLFIGAIQDVTESKNAEEALNKARSELAHVARVTTLNALTASIAHEVNQPLSGILTNASTCLRMLSADPPNVEGARETVRRIVRDGNRASDVISRLRTLFSKKEFTSESLDLNEATREVIALSLSDLQRSQVILRSELADDLPPVTGDRVQLQQVILNLVRNASDAMTTVEDRPRDLLIKTERDGGDRVRIIVKDVGVGFGPEAADKLFEAFYTTKDDGMGIGLSVSRAIIEAHHGRLWAVANDGPGATFSFSIPCRSGTLADSQPTGNPVDSARGAD